MKKLVFEEITLMGVKILIYDDKVQIFNEQGIPFEEFKIKSDRLVTYMMDEAFIERKKIRVEIVE